MAAQALEQSVLESKDKEQLLAIAKALGLKTTARSKKSDIIDQILETTGGPSGSPAPSAAAARAERADDLDAAVGANGAGSSNGHAVEHHVGVEIGQLIIVVVAATLLALAVRARPALTAPLARWGSVGVILAGTYWFVDRLFGIGGGA